MIKLLNVSKAFKSELLGKPFLALDNVSFEVPEGSMVGFLGANGAGKTTSLKIIMDFIKPTSGEIAFDPALGNSQMEIFRNVGFLPERPYFYPALKGRDFLKFMGSLSGMQPREIDSGIAKWAPRFRIEHALDRELKTYSKGMLQRIGFLATILHHPKLVILDEPLSGLDPIGRKELKDVIVDVHREGKTVFFSSHIVPDIEEICDRVIFLKEGKLAYEGSVSALMNSNSTLDFVISVRVGQDFKLRTIVKESLKLPDQVLKLTVESARKNDLLSELIEANCNVLTLEMQKPSLEEIFYMTRGQK